MSETSRGIPIVLVVLAATFGALTLAAWLLIRGDTGVTASVENRSERDVTVRFFDFNDNEIAAFENLRPNESRETETEWIAEGDAHITVTWDGETSSWSQGVYLIDDGPYLEHVIVTESKVWLEGDAADKGPYRFRLDVPQNTWPPDSVASDKR